MDTGARGLPRHPALACAVVAERGRVRAQLPDGVLEIRPRGLPLARVLAACDGATPYERIRDLAARAVRPALDRLVAALAREGVLLDGGDADAPRAQALRRAALAEARREARGARFRAPAFPLRRLLEQRRSVRAFAGRPVPLRAMLAMLWAANGCVPAAANDGGRLRRTVPSAGAIHPLRIGLLTLRDTAGLRRGAYLAHFGTDGSVTLRRTGAAADALRAFVDPVPLRGAQGALVVFGNATQTARKYGRRASLLVPLEAGHAAYAATLAATSLGVAGVELCGFDEARLRALFGAPRGLALTTLAFGVEATAAPEAREFNWLETDEPLAFHAGWIDVTLGRETHACWGRAQDPALAVEKALAEAAERSAAHAPAGLYAASLRDARAPIDPSSLIAHPIRPFPASRRHLWKEGLDVVSGRRRSVLAECVYFAAALPARYRRGAWTSATSSGVAAFPDFDGALERATLELLERDAAMRAWQLREPGALIASLPAAFTARIRRLRSAGVRVVVRLLAQHPAFAFLVFAQNARAPFTVVTSAAGFDPEAALDHALMEAEAAVAVRLEHPPASRTLRARDLRTAEDHAAYYATRPGFRSADLFARPGPRQPMPRRGRAGGLGALVSWARDRNTPLVAVDLTGKEPGPRVVRALVPGLVPLAFGHGRVPHPFS